MKKISSRIQYRSLRLSTGGVDFTSNDYLGLARSAALHEMIRNSYASLPLKRNGSTGSRLLSGNSELITNTEEKLAQIFNSKTTLLFDSGYSANLAVLSTLPQRGDTIIMDELAHASLKDGARLSLASKWNFRHSDLNDLEKKLKSGKGEKWIVVESIYSMDGDVCPLTDVVSLATKYDARIVLDEAHSTGVLGERGNGLANALKLQDSIDVRVYTFGKAMGVHGACVAAGAEIKNLLVNFSRPFIYTTAPSDHSVISVACAFDYLAKNMHLQSDLRSRIELMKSNTQIHVVLIPGVTNVQKAASQLQSAGFDVRPILSPTVKEGQERLRVCLHTFNTNAEIDSLQRELKAFQL